MHHKSLACFIGTLVLGSAPAWAQEEEEGGWHETESAPETQPAQPEAAPSKVDLGGGESGGGKIDLSTEPPAPPVARSHHVHDGFYLRGAMGLGLLGAEFEDDGTDQTVETGRGSLALDLMIGGSPSRGLAIGGALLSEAMVGAKYEVDGTEIGDGTVITGLLGAFIDGFPDPTGGFHVGGALGFSSVTAEELGESGDTLEMAGLGGAVWLGYDFWVGSEWSVGPLLRVMATADQDRGDDTDVTAVTRSITLSFTALYH